MAKISIADALNYAYQAGFRGQSQQTVVAIAIAESGLNTNAMNSQGNNAGVDRGVLQINSYWHSEVSDACAFDPGCAFKAGYKISSNGTNFHPWATYNEGKETQFIPEVQKAMTSVDTSTQGGAIPSWVGYPTSVPYGNASYDTGLGGSHDMDLKTPPDTEITFLLPGTITDISAPTWGKQVSLELDNPWQGVKYMAYLHLDAVNPTIKVGDHVTPGVVVGWSGGENDLSQMRGANNPTGQHFVDSSQMSSGPQIGIALMNGPIYGSGMGWISNPEGHPELNPEPLIQAAEAGNLGMIDGTTFSVGLNNYNAPTVGPNAPIVINRFNNVYDQVAQASHDTIAHVPGFFGICAAVDEAEQFPGIMNAFSGDKNPFDAPYNVVMTILNTVTGNIPPFFVRGFIALIGFLIVIGLILKAMEPVAKTAGSIVANGAYLEALAA